MDVACETTKLVGRKCVRYMEGEQKFTSRWLKPFLANENPLPDDPTFGQKIRHGCLCPPHGYLAHIFTLVFILFMLWSISYGLFGHEALPPGGQVFALLLLSIGTFMGAQLVNMVHLPPLLGMLLAGVLLKNVPYVREQVGDRLDDRWSAVIRQIALVVILVRGGVNLDPHLVWRLKGIVLKLSIIPCLAEAVAAGIVAHFLLDFPWIWGFLLGFVLSAVSPAVVVPSLIALQEQRRGTAKGIPTLGIAASSVNQIVAIVVFGVLLGATFSQGNVLDTIFQGPIQLGIGIGYGLIFGIAAWFIPHEKENNAAFYRFLIIMGGGLTAVLVGQKINYPGAGALGCLLFAFMAGFGLRKAGGDALAGVVTGFAVAWDIFQPLLFALIGAKIDINELEPSLIWKGFLCIAAGLLFCCASCFFLSMGASLNIKERMFLALAWIPKATVQAAIGPLALDTAIATQAGPEDLQRGQEVLTIAVLTILLTAPLGAIAINVSGPHLLQKEDTSETNQELMPNNESRAIDLE